MNPKRFLGAAVLLGVSAMPSMPVLAGVTVTTMQGTMGRPFNSGSISGFGWNAAAGGSARATGGPLVLTL